MLGIFRRKKKGLIVVHPNSVGLPVFDIFGDLPEGFEDLGYQVDCSYVEAEGRDDYRWSEDLMHTEGTNKAILEVINELINKHGFEVKFVGWKDYEEYIKKWKEWVK